MDASDQGIFNTAVDWYKGRGFWFSPPEVKIQKGKVMVNSTGNKRDWPAHPMKDGLAPSEGSAVAPLWSVEFASLDQVYDVETRLNSGLAEYYRSHIRSTLEKLMKQDDPVMGSKRRLGAVVLEPMCLGAGGMVFVDPLFQRCLVDVVRESEDLFVEGAIEEGVDPSGWKGLPVVYDEGRSHTCCRRSHVDKPPAFLPHRQCFRASAGYRIPPQRMC
jgi:dethiobiotin synthetase/adenosylmethionine--8-amino-7-oxononanoate aminotransferase